MLPSQSKASSRCPAPPPSFTYGWMTLLPSAWGCSSSGICIKCFNPKMRDVGNCVGSECRLAKKNPTKNTNRWWWWERCWTDALTPLLPFIFYSWVQLEETDLSTSFWDKTFISDLIRPMLLKLITKGQSSEWMKNALRTEWWEIVKDINKQFVSYIFW